MARGVVESFAHMAVAPGLTIKEQLQERGMSQGEFALRMGMSEKHISHMINGRVALTADAALRLESVLGIPARFWLKLEAIYQDQKSRVLEEKKFEKETDFAGNFPVSDMMRLGWIPESPCTAWDKVLALRRFFEVARLDSLERLKIPGIVFRQLKGKEQKDYSLAVWSQKARIEARKILCSKINIEKLSSLIPGIRKMTTEEIRIVLPKLIDHLAECGVALVVLPHISSSFLHGASFMDGEKIVAGVSYRGKWADIFWFSLFHELGHIIHGDVFSLLPESNEEAELSADVFAQECLIPAHEYSVFVGNGRFTESSITAFADSISVAPFIVLGRLKKENRVSYSKLTKLMRQYDFDEILKGC